MQKFCKDDLQKCIFVSRGARSAQLYNNVIRVKAGRTANKAIVLGVSSSNAVYDNSLNGYESYNNVAYNNAIVAETLGALQTGIWVIECRDCAVLNNIIIGAQTALRTQKATGGIAAGWAWEPRVRDRFLKTTSL